LFAWALSVHKRAQLRIAVEFRYPIGGAAAALTAAVSIGPVPVDVSRVLGPAAVRSAEAGRAPFETRGPVEGVAGTGSNRWERTCPAWSTRSRWVSDAEASKVLPSASCRVQS
jgi:hypothetical protein